MTTLTLPVFTTGKPGGMGTAARHTRAQLADLADAATAAMLTAHAAAADGVMQDATAAMLAMRPAAAQAPVISERWVRAQPAYAALAASTASRYAVFGQSAQQLVWHYGLSGVNVGISAGTLYLSYLGKYTIRSPLTTTGVQQLVDQLSDWLDGNDTLAAIQSQTNDGLIGMFVNGLRNWVKGKPDAADVATARDTITRGPQARLATVAQTTVGTAARTGMGGAYEAADATHWQWYAQKSGATCLACLGMDGQVFPIENGFDMMHPNCLCQPLPCGPEGLTLQTGSEWFAKQDADTQRAKLPGDTYQAYRDGDLELSDFVGLSHDPQHGNTVYQRSGKMALEASKR